MAKGSHDCRRCPRCRVNCCYSRGYPEGCLGDVVRKTDTVDQTDTIQSYLRQVEGRINYPILHAISEDGEPLDVNLNILPVPTVFPCTDPDHRVLESQEDQTHD